MAHLNNIIAAMRAIAAKLDEAAGSASIGSDKLSNIQEQTARLGAEGTTKPVAAAASDTQQLQAQLARAKEQTEQIIAATQRVIDGSYTTGTATTGPGTVASDDHSTRRPSLPPDSQRRPQGTQHPVHPSNDDDRALRRENECADVLARHGYSVEQSPPAKANGRCPDYRIEGEYWDCYSPETSDVDKVRNKISMKVKKGQADRIILNTDDCGVDSQRLRQRLETKPITGLREIKIVQNGAVTEFFPWQQENTHGD